MREVTVLLLVAACLGQSSSVPLEESEITWLATDTDVSYPLALDSTVTLPDEISKFYVYIWVDSGYVCARMWWSTTPSSWLAVECGTKYFHLSGVASGTTRDLVIHVTAEQQTNTLSVGWSEKEPKEQESESAQFEHIWWSSSEEYVFLDRALLIIMIVVATIFELIHRAIEKAVIGSNVTTMALKVWGKVNAEFMVLGFIAFTLWLVERSGGLSAVCKIIIPHEVEDMLHAIEDTHMRLFMAMIVYFFVMTWLVLASESYKRAWAATQEDILLNTVKDKYPTHATDFLHMEKKFKETLMAVPPKAKRSGRPLTATQIERFNFAAYLCKTLDVVTLELVAIKLPTWAGTAILTLGLALVVHFDVVLTNEGVFWIMVGTQLVMLGLVIMAALFTEWSFRHAVQPHKWGHSSCCSFNRFNMEIFTSRFFQMCVFYSCYTLLYFLTSVDARLYFHENPHYSVTVFIFLYVVPFILMTVVTIPLTLPRFNIVFRTPPHFDDREAQEVIRIAIGKYHTEFFPRLFPEKFAKKNARHHKKQRRKNKVAPPPEEEEDEQKGVFESSASEFSAVDQPHHTGKLSESMRPTPLQREPSHQGLKMLQRKLAAIVVLEERLGHGIMPGQQAQGTIKLCVDALSTLETGAEAATEMDEPSPRHHHHHASGHGNLRRHASIELDDDPRDFSPKGRSTGYSG